MIGGPARAARHGGPRRATWRTSGTSRAASRATSTMTPRPTDSSSGSTAAPAGACRRPARLSSAARESSAGVGLGPASWSCRAPVGRGRFEGRRRRPDPAASRREPRASSRSASAMSCGTPVRAVSAATAQANPTIRRRARPWVMITAPFTPRSGEPPARLVVEDLPDPPDARAQQQVRQLAPNAAPELAPATGRR